MPNTQVVRLLAHPVLAKGAGASVAQGGCLIAFGLPFVAIGGYLAWVLKTHPERFVFGEPRMPLTLVYGIAALFAVSGLLVWWSGLRAIFASLGFERRLRRHSSEPWLVDRAWNPKGDHDHPLSAAVLGLFFPGFFALFLLPFNWWMSVERWIPGILIIGFFDLLLVAYLTYWLYTVGRSMKYGAAFVRYDRFPFFLGETLDVRLGCRGRLDRFERLTVVVRFIRVKKEQSGNSTQAVCYQHWAEELLFDRSLLHGARELPISVPLPTGDYGTWLSDDPPHYWEIEAKGEAAGIDFLARFLLPVYARQ